ncbi:unnamed protein product, partial [Discosporangium mesarthrocarpum]
DTPAVGQDDEDEPTGKKLWDCNELLFNLTANPNPGNSWSVKGQRVVELGGGTGALAVGLIKAGAAHVTCTDLPCHLARIQETVNANKTRNAVVVAALRWGRNVAHLTPPFDVVVMSEVLYWPALDLLQEDTLKPLRKTLIDLSRHGTRVLIVYKERWPEREKRFLDSCEAEFKITHFPRDTAIPFPKSTDEDPGPEATRAVMMTRVFTNP